MAGQSLAAFVRGRTALLRDAIRAGTLFVSKPPPLVLSIGNEACDLDSVACALAHAYLWDRDARGRPYVPVLGAPRIEAVRLRGDVQHALGAAGLRPDDAAVLSEVADAARAAEEPLDVFLVDHNELSVHWGDTKVSVCGIVDHHEDAGRFLDAQPRVIQTCGSCCSLVALAAAEREETRERLHGDVADLLFRAIVTDTVGMTWRATDTDARALSLLSGMLGDKALAGHSGTNVTVPHSCQPWDVPHAQRHPLVQHTWREMEAAQASVAEEDVPLATLVHKDYKQYADVPGLRYGIAVLHVPFAHYIAQHPDGISGVRDTVRQFMADAGVSLLLFVNSIRSMDSSAHVQQFGVFTLMDSPAALADIVRYMHAEARCGLAPIASDGCAAAVFDQANLEMTRKKIHPAVRAYLLRPGVAASLGGVSP